MTPPLVRFDGFEVDLRARELRRGANRIRLQDQPFHILAMLLEHPGDLVTRDEIRSRLWPDGTFVDFEHSVNAAIKRLRTALGDTAENPRFVETLHRRGYRFVGRIESGAALSPTLHQPAAARRRPRLVVLPFANLSSDAPDYFSDGMTEEMIAQLGRRCAEHIGVLARTSSMLYKNVVKPASDIGEALHADYLVEGSVRRDGDRVRITAQLIETKEETHLWAESYDRELSDCLAVQSEVASEIAHALMLELLPGPSGASPATRHPSAYQAYLRGRYHWNRQGEQGLAEAIAFYDEALALDPRFGKAYSARARARVSRCDYYAVDPRTALAQARRDAMEALACDPADADAHLALGEVRRTLDWDWAGAEEAYRTALAANPNSDAALRYYASFLAVRGRREARDMADRARDRDPLCLTVNTAVATVRYYSGEYREAVQQFEHTLAMERDFILALRGLSAALVQLGRADEAVAALKVVPDGRLDPVSLAWLGHALAAGGHRPAAEAIAARLEQRRDHVPPFHLALLQTGLGQIDRAFNSLEAACDGRDPMLDSLDIDPRFAPLRHHSRYAPIVERLKLDTGARTPV